MKKPAAIPLFGDAYLADTAHLTTEEHGAYLLLLIHAWRQEDCAIRSDPQVLARITRLSLKRWKAIAPTVLDFFQTMDDGRIFQARLRKEWRYLMGKSEKASEAAASRWKKDQLPFGNESNAIDSFPAGSGQFQNGEADRTEKTQQNKGNGSCERIADAMPDGMRNAYPSTSTSTSTSVEEEDGDNNDVDSTQPARENLPDPFGDIGALTARCGRAAGVAIMPNRKNFPDQLDAVRSWVALGLDPDTEIIPELERYAVSDNEPRHSLRYFTPAMAKIAARKDARANGRHHDRPDIRGSRPDPALDMLRAAERAEDAERAARRGPDRGGTRLALPSR